MPKVLAALAAVFFAVPVSHALDCIDYSQLPRLVGRETALTSIGDVVVAGDLAYVAGRDTPAGLWVVDVSDPEQPTNVGFTALPDRPRTVAWKDDHVFVACETAGLQILDVSDPVSPVVVASVPSLDRTFDLAVAGDLVWIADWAGGFAAIDVSDPTAPIEVSRESAEPIWLLDEAGGILFTVWNGDPENHYRAWDVTDPLAPALLGSAETEGCVWPFWCDSVSDVELVGDYAYVAWNCSWCVDQYNCWDYSYAMALQVWDLSDPANPVRPGSAGLAGGPDPVAGFDLAVQGNRAYVASSAGALFVVDLADPVAPELLHGVPTSATGQGVAADPGGDLVFVADDGLSVYDVANPGLADAIGGTGVSESLLDVALIGDVAYTVGSRLIQWPGSFTMRGWDVADPEHPTELFASSSPGYGFFGDLEVASGDLYRSGHSSAGYQLVRSEILPDGTTGPMTPVFAPALDAEPHGSHLFVASRQAGFSVLETHPDDDPDLVAQLPGEGARVAADGELAVLLEGSYFATGVLHTIDVSDPLTPAFLGTTTLSAAQLDWIALQGDLVAVGGARALGQIDIRLVDVSDPTAPTEIAAIDPARRSVDGAFFGSALYVTFSGGGCLAIDVSDPFAPVVKGTIPTDPATALLVTSGFVLACEGNAVTGLPVDCPATVGTPPPVVTRMGLRIQPNPFRESTTILYELARPGARVELFDTQGRFVRSLPLGRSDAGTGAVVWDGRDRGGRHVAPGVYFLKLVGDDGRVTGKATYLR